MGVVSQTGIDQGAQWVRGGRDSPNMSLLGTNHNNNHAAHQTPPKRVPHAADGLQVSVP